MMLMELDSGDTVQVTPRDHQIELVLFPTRTGTLTSKEAQQLASALRVYGELAELEH